jgi:hypothetical protein
MTILPLWSAVALLCIIAGVVAASMAGKYFSVRQRVTSVIVAIVFPLVGGVLVVLYVLYCHLRATRRQSGAVG